MSPTPHRMDDLLSQAPEGWHKLVSELLDALGDVPEWRSEYVLQIKSKFGGLRVYYAAGKLATHAQSRVDALIRKAEVRADKTCENCGATDDVQRRQKHPGGWLITSCDACWATRYGGP